MSSQESSATSQISQDMAAPGLTPDAILGYEFNYIAQSAFQANEDRARVTTFYLISLGSLVAALLSSQLVSSSQPEIYALFICIFIVLSVFGWLTILQLVRLRQAWYESAQALNKIKTFYIQNIHTVKLEEAFRWKPSNLPAKFKWGSVSFALALQVALVSGISCGAAFIYIGSLTQLWGWLPAMIVGTLYVIIQMAWYKWSLK
jgi:hypothetical protein